MEDVVLMMVEVERKVLTVGFLCDALSVEDVEARRLMEGVLAKDELEVRSFWRVELIRGEERKVVLVENVDGRERMFGRGVRRQIESGWRIENEVVFAVCSAKVDASRKDLWWLILDEEPQ